MLNVEIENFQSIRQVSLSIEGFTSLDGRSNIGKSAVVRAIRCALTGAAGTDFVRHRDDCERKTRNRKECKCQSTVRIQTRALGLVWEKGDFINRYTVTAPGKETQVYDSVSRGTPDFLLPDFQKVKVGDTAQLLQVSEQFSPIFLLDQSGPTVADVLSDVAHLEDINAATRLVNKDRKESAATKKVREADLSELQRGLLNYENLDPTVHEVDSIEVAYSSLRAESRTLETLESFLSEAVRLKTWVQTLQNVLRVDPPDSSALQDISDRFLQIQSFYSKVATHLPIVKALSGVPQVLVPEASPVKCLSGAADLLERHLVAVQKLGHSVDGLTGAADLCVPDLQTLLEGQNTLGVLDGWLKKAVGLSWVPRVISSLDELPKLESGIPSRTLVDLVGAMDKALKVAHEVESLEADVRETDDALGAVLLEFEALGLCPTCTQPVHVERCVSRGP